MEGKLSIKFPSNKGTTTCPLDCLSRSPPPPLIGGYSARRSITPDSTRGDSAVRLVHGEQGEVMGPFNDEGELEIKFPNNKGNVACPLDELSRSPPPPLPGGYTLGEKLYFIGANHTLDDGNRLVHGEQVEVMGPFWTRSHQVS